MRRLVTMIGVAAGLLTALVACNSATLDSASDFTPEQAAVYGLLLKGATFEGSWMTRSSGDYKVEFSKTVFGDVTAEERAVDSDINQTVYNWSSSVRITEPTMQKHILCLELTATSFQRVGSFCIWRDNDGKLRLTGGYTYNGEPYGSVNTKQVS